MIKIEITNEFTGSVTIKEVHASKAWAALNHFRNSWGVSKARFV